MDIRIQPRAHGVVCRKCGHYTAPGHTPGPPHNYLLCTCQGPHPAELTLDPGFDAGSWYDQPSLEMQAQYDSEQLARQEPKLWEPRRKDGTQ